MGSDKQSARHDMSVLDNRLDLVNRYNYSVGDPGPQVAHVQREFLNGLMPHEVVGSFVAQCEAIIDARRSMVPRNDDGFIANPQWPYSTVPASRIR